MNEKNKKSNKTGIILILLIIIVAGAFAYTTYFKKDDSSRKMRGNPGQSNSEMVYSVYAEEIANTTMTDYLEFNGDVIAAESIDLYPDVSGKLSKLNVSLGDYVNKGQIVAQVNPSVPGKTYSENPVTSTIDGTVIDVLFDEGATIASTSVPIVTIGNLSDLELDCFISEKYISAIKLDLNAEITFEAYKGIVFNGKITEISPVLDSNSRTLEIKIGLNENTDNLVKTGMFGSIKLITEVKNDVISVASSSISTGNEGSFVYVISDDNKATLRYVKTGLEMDGQTEIVDGLNIGEMVINRGQSMLKDGSSVNVVEE